MERKRDVVALCERVCEKRSTGGGACARMEREGRGQERMAVETETALESYFEFHDNGAIWIRGHRVGIDLLIESYKAGMTPEQIAEEFDTIRLEDIYATITYYLHNRGSLDTWLGEIDARFNRTRDESLRNPSPAAARLREIWEREQKDA